MASMVHDSDPNAAKTCFVHVKSGDQTLSFDPHLKKWGSIDPLPWPRASAVYACQYVNITWVAKQTRWWWWWWRSKSFKVTELYNIKLTLFKPAKPVKYLTVRTKKTENKTTDQKIDDRPTWRVTVNSRSDLILVILTLTLDTERIFVFCSIRKLR